MVRKLIRYLDNNHPGISHDIRTLRESRNFRRQKPQKAFYDFLFLGNPNMLKQDYELDETTTILDFLPKVDGFVDIGANIGFYACLARSRGKPVVAVEPYQGNLDFLYANLLANQWEDVEIFPVGLSKEPGILNLYGSETGASLISGWAGASNVARQHVAVSTLDTVLSDRFDGKKLFIKMDVEGSELGVLQGATRTLTMSPRPVWMIEICLEGFHPSGYNPYFEETFQLMWKNGYRSRTAGKDSRSVTPEHIARWVQTKQREFGWVSYVFEHGEE